MKDKQATRREKVRPSYGYSLLLRRVTYTRYAYTKKYGNVRSYNSFYKYYNDRMKKKLQIKRTTVDSRYEIMYVDMECVFF